MWLHTVALLDCLLPSVVVLLTCCLHSNAFAKHRFTRDEISYRTIRTRMQHALSTSSKTFLHCVRILDVNFFINCWSVLKLFAVMSEHVWCLRCLAKCFCNVSLIVSLQCLAKLLWYGVCNTYSENSAFQGVFTAHELNWTELHEVR